MNRLGPRKMSYSHEINFKFHTCKLNVSLHSYILFIPCLVINGEVGVTPTQGHVSHEIQKMKKLLPSYRFAWTVVRL